MCQNRYMYALDLFNMHVFDGLLLRLGLLAGNDRLFYKGVLAIRHIFSLVDMITKP